MGCLQTQPHYELWGLFHNANPTSFKNLMLTRLICSLDLSRIYGFKTCIFVCPNVLDTRCWQGKVNKKKVVRPKSN